MSPQQQTLKGKVAIVTGGTRGIGEAIVKLLASRGADVVINYTSDSSESLAKNLIEQVKTHGVKAVSVQADMGSLDAPKKIVNAAVEAFGKIDIIVNNGGVADFKPLTDLTVEHYEKIYNVNVRGPLFLVKESIPHLQEYGRIINISSVAARLGLAGSSVYASSKTALESLSRVWATELADKNVTSNSVNPGPVLTNMLSSLGPEFVDGMQKSTERAAFPRFGTVEEIANIVGFLAGPESQWVTGDVLSGNGGYLYL
ncbi:hypothetical protein INT43_007532 [Umbelopsis isabellina]|uniref:Ketoreductase domain-containing protein n=1 Tax=Mortierella isabellina TaxID=91625 RepID=A0A8H7PN49_MORIS|nr:hypothetical protein INT43_007532 [Umbelopsis isabellina]